MNATERARKVAHLVGLYPIVDDAPGRWHDLRAVLESTLRAGARVVQLRLKHTRDRDALELARWAVARAHAASALLIVNDRLDLASLCRADGVHLGTDDLPPEQVPPELRRELLVGLSTHTLDQVLASRTRPVDYIGFGPIFGTRSKASEYAPRGVELLARAVREAATPVVAIGGIDAKGLGPVARTRVSACAVISALADAPDPGRATTDLQALFDAERLSSPGE